MRGIVPSLAVLVTAARVCAAAAMQELSVAHSADFVIKNKRHPMNRFFIVVATALLLAACGSKDDSSSKDGGGFGGTYNGGDGAFFDSLTFNKDGTVEIAFLGETTKGTWRIDEDNDVLIDANTLYPNSRGLFRQIPGDCVDGRSFIGQYCKSSRGQQANAPAAGFGGAYVSDYEGVLNFEPDGTFEHYMRGGLFTQPRVEAAGTWKARGHKVLIIAQGSGLSGMILGDDGCLRDPAGGYGKWCQAE